MNREKLNAFIRQFFGQGNFLVVSVPMIRLMGNEPEGALFLSQLVYWSDKSTLKDGWFYKSYPEWEGEIFLSEYKIKKFSKFLGEKGVLETQVKKVYGTPTVHYRVHMEKLLDWIVEAHQLENVPVNPGPVETPWDQEKDTVWETIPSAAEQLKFVPKGKLGEVSKWSAQYKILSQAPDWAKTVSYYLNVHTGFEPVGKPKVWLSECQQLWSAAKQNEDLLIAGLLAGEKARRERGLTMSGPRSYINFCRNEASLKNQSQMALPTPLVVGQTVHQTPGKTQVEIEL